MSSYARQEREVRRLSRQLALQTKEQAKFDEETRARLAVQSYESQVELLLSLHKEVGDTWDWAKVAASLPPLPPVSSSRHEMRVRQLALVQGRQPSASDLEAAKIQDSEACRISQQSYAKALDDWGRMTALAHRIIRGEPKAYFEALSEFSPLAELVDLGSELDFTIHSKNIVGCVISMKDTQAIPAETKSLTATGKLSVKATPRARFHEIYQDYICGGLLRVARELFALLPVEHAIVTAITPVFDPATGNTADKPVLSVLISRDRIQHFQWDKIDPSDAIDRLVHRGDFKASRKSGAFLPIEPLTPAILAGQANASAALADSIGEVATLRRLLQAQIAELTES